MISKSILVQVAILAVLAITVLVLAGLDLVDGTLGLGWAAGGLLAGVAIGIFASRIRRMDWDGTAGRVIAHIAGSGPSSWSASSSATSCGNGCSATGSTAPPSPRSACA